MINDNEATNSYFISNEYYFIKKVKPPIVDENIIISYNKIIDGIKNSNKLNKTLLVGAIKFKDNENIEYIHCPLLNIEESKDICIGVCKHFESVKNDCEGKKILASHKYQFHYKCKSMKKNGDNNIKIFLKTNKSIQEVLKIYENRKLI